jgi:iron complex transport system substrate-binding protein
MAACSPSPRRVPESGNLGQDCIQSFDPSKDYFPKKLTPEFARNFSVEYHRSYKVVTVHQASQSGGSERYILLQCGAPRASLDAKPAQAPIITIPIVSLFSESTTHEQPLVELGHVDVLTGVAGAKYALNEQVRARIHQGKIVDFSPNGTINAERVIAGAPAILMSSRNDDPAFAAIRNGGVPVVTYADWLDQSALGRAEWIKFMALFLNEEDKAEKHFAKVRDAYRSWATRTADIPKAERPRVTTGGVFRGNYIVAGGRSYVAGLIADAGGDYVWSDNDQTGSPVLDVESGIARAASADYWINGGPWSSLQAMLSDEPRYKEFKAFRRGQVWLYNRRVSPEGTNEYWFNGVSRPDLILADLIKIFHPGLAEDHEFMWYLQVPSKP